jgi:pimeloyl-ACP methyl ester carboxylesterase
MPTLIAYVLLTYFGVMIIWIMAHLLNDTAARMLSRDQNKLRATGVTFSETQDKGQYTIQHTVEDGIERITYTPKQRRHKTPILMAHGMWHGAWCWQTWQELLAKNGWESIAFSLPGHAQSPRQRALINCTLGYYLSFVHDEVKRLPRKPILMGHSMGGALTQWYLRFICDDLPAVVLVAPWVAFSVLADGFIPFLKLDPLGALLMFVAWSATPWMRTPHHAATKLVSPTAIIQPADLQKKLNGESALVLFQHNPPFWSPPKNIKTPTLILAGEQDAVVTVAGLKQTAAHYKADFSIIPAAGHNLMMEPSYRHTAEKIAAWLSARPTQISDIE